MKRQSLLLASALLLAASASAQMAHLDEIQNNTVRLYDERYRPQFHFSPPKNFMNDPNGLVYRNGTYHLYYQYNPFAPVAGNQNWGHATSSDLIHWKNLPIAIPNEPQTGGLIFSGSAVVDSNNTSGFFSGTPGGGLVAIYTLATYPPFANPATQVQDIAYSLDDGTTYTKYSGNPVLDVKNPNFRDPYVFWYEPTKSWIMAVALANNHQIQFYSSFNLKNWNYLSSFGPAGTLGEAYEVPNLIHVPIEGTNQKKWVLLVSINPGVPQGGSATQYFIGEFNGTTFKPDDAVTRWMEFGKDAYAMLTYNNLPTQDIIGITWVGNWQYAQEVPTSPWRSAMSVPRFLTLRNTADGLTLIQQPISLAALRDRTLYNGSTQVSDDSDVRISLGRNFPFEFENLLSRGPAGRFISFEHNSSFEFETTVSADAKQQLNIDVRNSSGEKVTIGYDWDKRQLYVNRGDTRGFENPFFTSDGSSFLPTSNGQLKLHALVDRSIIELFVNDGERVSTMVFFMKRPASELRLSAKNGIVNVQDLRVYTLRSIWQ